MSAGGIPASNPLYYAGTLTEGGQLVSGSRSITVTVWPDATSQGTPLCTTTASKPPADVVNGRFRIALASACKTAINQNSGAYLEVLDETMSLGRTPVGAVAYAVEADHASRAAAAAAAGTAAAASSATGGLASSISALQTNVTSLQGSVSSIQTADGKFVDLSSNQSIGGLKTFTGTIQGTASDTGPIGGTGAVLATHQPHTIPFGSDGDNLHFWVDGTNNVATLARSATAKTFITDHPTDAGRYLVHATLEGPENAVFYRGSARLRAGVAEISLPAYFEAATRPGDRTVLVTPTFDDASAPLSALAASHVKNGSFTVRGVDRTNLEQAFDWE